MQLKSKKLNIKQQTRETITAKYLSYQEIDNCTAHHRYRDQKCVISKRNLVLEKEVVIVHTYILGENVKQFNWNVIPKSILINISKKKWSQNGKRR